MICFHFFFHAARIVYHRFPYRKHTQRLQPTAPYLPLPCLTEITVERKVRLKTEITSLFVTNELFLDVWCLFNPYFAEMNSVWRCSKGIFGNMERKRRILQKSNENGIVISEQMLTEFTFFPWTVPLTTIWVWDQWSLLPLNPVCLTDGQSLSFLSVSVWLRWDSCVGVTPSSVRIIMFIEGRLGETPTVW